MRKLDAQYGIAKVDGLKRVRMSVDVRDYRALLRVAKAAQLAYARMMAMRIHVGVVKNEHVIADDLGEALDALNRRTKK